MLLVNRSLALLPDRRKTAAFLVCVTVLAMGKFYVREVGLGQSNLLLAVLALAAVACWRSRRDVAAGALLAAATIVKPYAILFLPYLVARRTWAGVASYAAVLVAALILPAARYGWSGNLGQLHGWWSVVTTSTAPNLAGQDNVSIAGMYAAWLGVGPAAGWLGAATGLALVIACAWVILRGSRVASPEYLDAGLLLFAIPLLSPQGWDYVLLVSTPAVMLLLDRLDEFRAASQMAAVRVARDRRPDVLGRPRPRAVPRADDVAHRHRGRAVPGDPRDARARAAGGVTMRWGSWPSGPVRSSGACTPASSLSRGRNSAKQPASFTTPRGACSRASASATR